MTESASRPRITAVLGPTNTGKTFFAIERMASHASGMIGFPLRLLARENYDRVVRLKGRHAVALVTGEEKIVPPGATYFLCTVESMPVDRPVDFLAVDEVQLAADRERGHVFTDRLLHARGEVETMFLGAETARRVIRRLVPQAEYLSRPRFSKLAYTGPRRLTRLPPRSAAVAFSAAGVYELAEQMRRRQGGVAVVLGALSPRTRNAQVGLFEAGEVDYLVATDAIGMGLNLDINHVAFAGLVKFDGTGSRRLGAQEIGQIAGRAGRYLADGTFGTTGPVGPLDPEVVERVESHDYEYLRGLYWRNHELAFSSVDALRRSLEAPPPDEVLLRAPEADDHRTLIALAGRDEVRERADRAERVRLLWEVCQVPDFRKILSDSHAALLARIYVHLTEGPARLPADWVAKQIASIDRTDGEIEALTQRISFIRTWTYISHRGDWVDDAAHWQERTRAIEDKLSDALHDRLTQRFVDRRAATLVRGLAAGRRLNAAITSRDEVVVEGEAVGRLDGFRFVADPAAALDDSRAINAAALQVLRESMPVIVRRLADSPDKAFTLDDAGRVHWRGGMVARLERGVDPLTPQVAVVAAEGLDVERREEVRRRLEQWTGARIRRLLPERDRLNRALDGLAGSARGLAFQLVESLGVLERQRAAAMIDALDKGQRKDLARLGVRIGTESVYVAGGMRPEARALRAVLWAIFTGAAPLRASAGGGPSFAPGADVPPGAILAQGYVPVAGLAVRADAVERFAAEARKLARQGPFLVTPAIVRLVGLSEAETGRLLGALGFRASEENGLTTFARGGKARPPRGRGKKARFPAPRAAKADPDSPFAKLRVLKFAR